MTTQKKQEVDDKGKVRVFTYGTLKNGHSNHRLLKNAGAQFLGFDSVTGPYRMYDMGSFPAVLDQVTLEPMAMRGEVWVLNPEGLASIDLLEGNPHFYARRKLWTDRLQKRVWMYFLNNSWVDEVSDDDLLPDFIWNPSASEKEFWKIGDGS